MNTLSLGSIYHMPWLAYRHALPDGRVCIRLRTGRNNFTSVQIKVSSTYDLPDFFAKASIFEMPVCYQDNLFDYYEIIFTPKDVRIRYLFVLRNENLVLKLDSTGLHVGENWEEDVSKAFAFAYAYPTRALPKWTEGCVGYQIFPDRFKRISDSTEWVEPWNSDRVQNEFRFGGNIKGIIDSIDYLHDLGITLLYMTPLFLSDTSHRYNTFDYYQIDPLLGTKEELATLCKLLHEKGMRLILDGVFNHCGLGFEPFIRAKEDENSPYRDWFHFDNKESCGYRTFGHWPYMPKLNMENEACANYFIEVGRYWLREIGIDGWRMDVSPEVHPRFWRSFKEMMLKENPDSLLIAECWDDSREWLSQDDMFDSTMHYVLSRNIWDCFCKHQISAKQFDEGINQILTLYTKRTHEVLWTFLGTHDTMRARTRASGDLRMLHIAAFFQFTYFGTPIIYYGDELGMEGGDDPYCRFPMRWEQVDGNCTHQHFKRLASIRKNNPALYKGQYKTYMVMENGLYAYERFTEDQHVLCVINTSLSPIHCQLPLTKELKERNLVHNLYNNTSLPVQFGCISVSLQVGEGLILQ